MAAFWKMFGRVGDGEESRQEVVPVLVGVEDRSSRLAAMFLTIQRPA
jgi:hypothetical protein